MPYYFLRTLTSSSKILQFLMEGWGLPSGVEKASVGKVVVLCEVLPLFLITDRDFCWSGSVSGDEFDASTFVVASIDLRTTVDRFIGLQRRLGLV